MPSAASDTLAALLWLAATALLLAAAAKLARRLFPADPLHELIRHTILISLAAVVAAGSAATYVTTGRPTPRCRRYDAALLAPALLPEAPAEKAWLVTWAALVAFWLGHVCTAGLIQFPADFDSLMYHLPLTASWLQHRSLATTDIQAWSVPAGNELVGLWMVAPSAATSSTHS